MLTNAHDQPSWKPDTRLAALGILLLIINAACQTTPTFVAGTGNTLGTLSHAGVDYQILTDGSGAISQIISSAGNTFDIAADGSLSGVELPDGTTFGFVTNANGTITVSFSNSPQFGSGQLTVDPGNIGGRPKAADAARLHTAFTEQGNGSSVLCNRLVPACETISFFLEVVLPIVRDEIISHMVGNHSELPFADSIAGGILDSYVNDALNHCAGIQLIALVECE